ncbi:MAG: substrate-binding domain-containing protein [Pseudomonadota bacterium]|nr:substrate-binding domain-containing protein [Pseudomonadota bacterium]
MPIHILTIFSLLSFSTLIQAAPASEATKEVVEIGIAYGTEKRNWLEWAKNEFAKTEAGKKININLFPMGSIKGAKTILDRDKRIHIWAPANSWVKCFLVQSWQQKHEKQPKLYTPANPIFSAMSLVSTPMVIAMWQHHYEAFIEQYPVVNFKTIAKALSESTGWLAIADKPEWGLFNFAHTQPTESNSGLLALVLMAYDYAELSGQLELQHIKSDKFVAWLKDMQDRMLTNETSTNKLMEEYMLHLGPAELSGVVVYENVALTYLKSTQAHWHQEIKIIYPRLTILNDNPFYILEVPWTTPEHQYAAELFQQFLLSKVAQKQARDGYFFRPEHAQVELMAADSAFIEFINIIKEKDELKFIQQMPDIKILKQLTRIWEDFQ